VTSHQARQVLLIHRPWVDDSTVPEVAEALALCRNDAQLREWFETHCATQEAVRDKLRSIPVPAGLREQILSERIIPVQKSAWRRSPLVGAIAGVIVVLAVILTIQPYLPGPGEDLSLAGYRQRMVRTALKSYAMDLETNDLAQVRAYLAQQNAPADFELTDALADTELVGCGLLRWQGHPVTMVCFKTGKPLDPPSKSDLFLFVISSRDLQDQNAPAGAELAQVSDMTTASWRTQDKVYVLAGFGETDVRCRL